MIANLLKLISYKDLAGRQKWLIYLNELFYFDYLRRNFSISEILNQINNE